MSARGMIPFVQFVRPMGDVRAGGFQRPPYIGDIAAHLAERGVRFEAEVLTTDEISLTAEIDRPRALTLLAHEVVPNGPTVPSAVDALVSEAFQRYERRQP